MIDAPCFFREGSISHPNLAKEIKSFRSSIEAEAEAYATGVVAKAIQDNGLEAAQYQVALKQVESLTALGSGTGSQTVVVPANALEAFGNAFNMLKGRG